MANEIGGESKIVDSCASSNWTRRVVVDLLFVEGKKSAM
jgi:hypothetical protein